MKSSISLGLLGLVLVGCGGQTTPETRSAKKAQLLAQVDAPSSMLGAPHLANDSPAVVMGSSTSKSADVVSYTDYLTATNQIYVAYFGRPADPAGLKYWAQALASNRAPTTIVGIEAAYDANPGIRGIVDSFGLSAESKALYTGSTAQFVNSIYVNVLGRAAEDAGKAWWANQIDMGNVTRARAAVAIMSGALGVDNADSKTITKKTNAAVLFTAGLDTDIKSAAYSGDLAVFYARAMLNAVSGTMSDSMVQANVDIAIRNVAPAAVVTTPPIITPPVVIPPKPVDPLSPCTPPASPNPVIMWDKTPMNNMCDNVYVEPGIPAAEELSVRQSVTYAYYQVTQFYGSMKATRPDMILCKTAACRSYFIGNVFAGVVAPPGVTLPGATYKVPRTTVLVIYTSFVGFGRGTITHELSHVEFGERIAGGRGAPAWFNEGQAIVIGKEPDCSPGYPQGVADLRTLDGGEAWQKAALGTGIVGTHIYCQAAHEIESWIAKNGKARFLAMLDDMKARQQFDTLYGPLVTQ